MPHNQVIRLLSYAFDFSFVHLFALPYDLCHNSTYTVRTPSPFGYHPSGPLHVTLGPYYMRSHGLGPFRIGPHIPEHITFIYGLFLGFTSHCSFHFLS